MASTTDILALARECGGVETTVAGSGQKRISFPVEQLAVFASRLQQGDAEMQADAERYRWIKADDGDGFRLIQVQFAGHLYDRMIDAARQSSAGGEGQAS